MTSEPFRNGPGGYGDEGWLLDLDETRRCGGPGGLDWECPGQSVRTKASEANEGGKNGISQNTILALLYHLERNARPQTVADVASPRETPHLHWFTTTTAWLISDPSQRKTSPFILIALYGQ